MGLDDLLNPLKPHIPILIPNPIPIPIPVPVPSPLDVIPDILQGKPVDKVLQDATNKYAQDFGKSLKDAAGSARDLNNQIQAVKIQIAGAIAGEPGKVLATVVTSPGHLKNETVTSTVEYVGHVFMTGQLNVNQFFAAQLAGVLRAAHDLYQNIAQPLPEDLQKAAKAYIPDVIIGEARYTISTLEVSLPAGINFLHFFGTGYAVTVGNIVVFNYPPTLRALNHEVHELVHVKQYKDWGYEKFAQLYIENGPAVEKQASDIAANVLAPA